MSPFKDKIIGVLLGGLSKEREISLESGQAILDALIVRGYDAVSVDVGRDVDKVLQEKGVEIAFLALHGRYGEDGSIQGLLEIRGIPYTGSSVLTSALAMDKYLTKDIARAEGLITPDDFFFDANLERIDDFLKRVPERFPLMVKPSREGSTIGIAKVSEANQLRRAVQEAASLDSRVLVEQFISGREVTVGVVNNEPLPVLEVITENEFYDFEAKYRSDRTQYRCPAELPGPLSAQLQEQAHKIYRRLGCEGAARVDFIVSENQVPYFLEVNTLPGMTSHSLVPKAAQVAGLSFSDLVEKILFSARLKIE